jgi:hypothetical protein
MKVSCFLSSLVCQWVDDMFCRLQYDDQNTDYNYLTIGKHRFISCHLREYLFVVDFANCASQWMMLWLSDLIMVTKLQTTII